jgi:uncharacterized protein (TIGR03118 family)
MEEAMKSLVGVALRVSLAGTSLGAASILSIAAAQATEFRVVKLVSDSGGAAHSDTNLINPWGLASSPTSPFWVANNGTGVGALYDTTGTPQPLVVTVNPSGAAPTGLVFNGNAADFHVTEGGKTGSAAFIFAGEDGTISGWAPGVALDHSIVAVPNLNRDVVYKGLAIGSSAGTQFLYASDFHNGMVEQFDSSFNLVRSFGDPTVAPGYAPFGTRVLGDHLFVTYALQDADKEDDVAGPGNGYVDEFNLDGTFVRQLVGQGGEIDSPWGLDIAPSSFGQFAGDLLVGNFGDGTISAFDLTSGMFDGKLLGTDGNPIVLGDLWALLNGNGAKGGDADKVYFTAGVSDEAHGLFGALAPVPEPASWALMLCGFAMSGMTLRARSARRALSIR